MNTRGEKHFLAIEGGVRESAQSWREVLLKLQSRGMNTARLAIGDGAMGFWAALEEVYPETKQQRCWMHKTANVLNALPKASQPNAKQALHDIWKAETKAHAEQAFDLFPDRYEAKYPKATACLQKYREELLAFYCFPAKHWQSLRTSNPIESAFGVVADVKARCVPRFNFGPEVARRLSVIGLRIFGYGFRQTSWAHAGSGYSPAVMLRNLQTA